MTSKKDYLLKAWGGKLKGCPPPEKEHDGAYYWWFETPEDRIAFIEKLPDAGVVTTCEDPIDFDGNERDTRKRTIAVMEFRLPSGEIKPLEIDFGYGYPASSAIYMFEDGNYSCDCNRSLFLEIDEMDCGNKIEMLSIHIDERD